MLHTQSDFDLVASSTIDFANVSQDLQPHRRSVWRDSLVSSSACVSIH